LIRSDGTLIKRITDSAPQVRWSDGGFTQVDTLKYPELADSLGPDKRGTLGKPDGYRYLDCGIKLLEYKEPELAEKCLKMASSLVPENPYPHYYLGVSLERQNKIEEAKNAYGVAVKTQAQSPNPIFEDALGKLR
jgi:tetratricopeptide (TPR) repeat protein